MAQAQVLRKLITKGKLSGGKSTWIGWKIIWGDQWYFWVNSRKPSGFGDMTLEIVQRYRRIDNKHWAVANIKNVGSDSAEFHLYVVRIFGDLE